MPVTRYRHVADMPPVPRAEPQELADRIRAAWRRAAVLAGLAPPRGVQRFRSLDEAQAARHQATRRRVRGQQQVPG